MKHVGLTDDLISSICDFVKTGSSFKNAYLLAGVNSHTGQYWRSRALEDLKSDLTADESVYIKLSNAMDKAKQAYIRSLVDAVNVAAQDPKQWQAAMTMLERIDPDSYSRFARVRQYNELNINPHVDSPVLIISKVLTGIVEGKISAKDGEQISTIIGTLIKTEESTEIKALLSAALDRRATLQKQKG